MLLSCQHEDSKDKLGGQKHLDEETLNDRGVTTEGGAHVDLALVREHASDQSSRSNTTHNLNDEQKTATNPGQCANQAHTKGNCRVEESTRDAEEDPGVDSKRKAEAKCDILQLLRIRSCFRNGLTTGGRNTVGDLGTRQREPQEENSADEFSTHSDEVVTDAVRQLFQIRQTQLLVGQFGIRVGGLGEGYGEGPALAGFL